MIGIMAMSHAEIVPVIFTILVLGLILWIVVPLRKSAAEPSTLEVTTSGNFSDEELEFDPSYRCGAEGCEACQLAEQIENDRRAVYLDSLGSE